MKRTALCLLLLLVTTTADAADAYFIRFSALGRQLPSGAPVQWVDDVLFYNTGNAPAQVRLVGVSNGASQPDAPELTLAPGTVTSLSADAVVAPKWQPIPLPVMWVLHLDIPPGVVTESRDELYVIPGVTQPASGIPRGKVSMTTFRELAPAGGAQVHLGTDLGGNDSRINVMIYNAGTDTAIASIEVRRTCDSSLMDRRTVAIPANTLLQVNGLSVGSSTGCPEPVNKPWARYTAVTVSQPSLTLISNINENIQPSPADIGLIPIIGLGVTSNQQF